MWETYVTPVTIAAVMSLLVKIIGNLVENKRIKVDGDACQRTSLLDENDELRKALMQERQDLVKELRVVADRCDKLENENAELHHKVIQLEKRKALLEVELERLKSEHEA